MGTTRSRYTLEFKHEAVRMVKGGQSLAATAKILSLSKQTLSNWLKQDASGKLGGTGKREISAEQMEIARLRAELAKTKLELEILGKATAYFAKRSA